MAQCHVHSKCSKILECSDQRSVFEAEIFQVEVSWGRNVARILEASVATNNT